MLAAIEGVTCLEPEGAFYCFPSFKGVLGRTVAGHKIATTLDLADVVLTEAKVAIVPGEAFGPDAKGWLRLTFASPEEAIREGVARLAAALS